MMDDVLNPGVVGIVCRQHPELPANVFLQSLAAPIRYIELRIGKDEIRPQIHMQVVVESVSLMWAKVGSVVGYVHLSPPDSFSFPSLIILAQKLANCAFASSRR